jgi:predicted Zn finger-like uncharacterized protein
MNLQCPNCQAEYAVPSARLGGRHVVRCGACDHRWTLGDAGDETDGETAQATAEEADFEEADFGESADGDADPSTGPVTAAARLLPPPPSAAAPSRWLAAAWLASTAAIAACIVAMFVYRTGVVAAWPPAGRLFAANHAPAEPAKPTVRAEPSRP